MAQGLVKLERAREVADADERTDMVTKVDALITNENQRHDTWVSNNKQKLQAQ